MGKMYLDLFLGNFKDIYRNQGEHSSLWYHASVHLSSQFAYVSEGVNMLLLFFCFWKCTVALQQYWESYNHVRSNLPFKETSQLPAAPNCFFTRLSLLRFCGLTCTAAWSLVCLIERNGGWGVTDWNVVWAPTKPAVRVVVLAGMLLNLHYPDIQVPSFK